MKQDTKFKIIETGAKIIRRKGYHHTGIQEILQAADVPKGSFYFYFRSKEDFGLQVIDFFNTVYLEMTRPILSDAALSPLDKIDRLLDWFIDLFTGMDYQCGCPIGNLSQEMGDLSPAFAEKLVESIDLITRLYEDLLVQAKALHEIDRNLDVAEAACFIVSSWHGALIRMKIVKTAGPLFNHKSFIMKMLTAGSPRSACRREKAMG